MTTTVLSKNKLLKPALWQRCDIKLPVCSPYLFQIWETYFLLCLSFLLYMKYMSEVEWRFGWINNKYALYALKSEKEQARARGSHKEKS